jgi:hypothetical protein
VEKIKKMVKGQKAQITCLFFPRPFCKERLRVKLSLLPASLCASSFSRRALSWLTVYPFSSTIKPTQNYGEHTINAF